MTWAESVYISASTNRHSHAASISASSLVAFASSKLLVLWDASDPTGVGAKCTLPGHQADINCVKVSSDNSAIFSGDQNGMLQIRMNVSGEWKIIIDYPAHSTPISALAIYNNMVITGSSDATVKVWRVALRDKCSIDLIQTLDMKGRFPLDIQFTSFPGTSCFILAVASTGRDIDIWSGNDSQLAHSTTLPGHEDWVKCLAFVQTCHSPPQLTLASGSQDATIRLWTIELVNTAHSNVDAEDDFFNNAEAPLEGIFEGEEEVAQLSIKRHVMKTKSADGTVCRLAVIFDALLVGHEAGITSVSWSPDSTKSDSPPILLSTSVDASAIVWAQSSFSVTPETSSTASLWINRNRFGDLGGQRYGGFIGGFWGSTGCEVLAWRWNGGWRRWRCDDLKNGTPEGWVEVGAITGHHDVAKSIAWASSGDYLLSAGLDQTTRIHGPCHPGGPGSFAKEVWHELARPQVHGYDVIGAEFLSPLRFVSISDEKVARVFDAPKSFVAMVNGLGTVKDQLSMNGRPAGANVPPLGLSNKAADDEESQGGDMKASARSPFEGELATETLWPEIEKVFGHGYELISIATSHSGSFAVTACKSSTAEHASLRVYNSLNWQLVGEPLEGHVLTVTRIAFNADDTLILSVSRDRSWRLFRVNPGNGGYLPLAADKAHARIIWDCAWTREVSEMAFATASRDKTVKIWQPVDSSLGRWASRATLKFKQAVTAVDFTPILRDGRRRLAVGLESGEVFVHSARSGAMDDWKLDIALDPQLCHGDTVHRVRWRPTNDLGETQQLATCGEDRIVKVMTVHLDFH